MIDSMIIGALFGLIGGVVASVLAFKTQKPVSEANAAQIIQTASADLIEEVRKQTQEQLRNFDLVYRDVVKGSWALHKQVKEAGKVPVYVPPAIPKDDIQAVPQYGGWR